MDEKKLEQMAALLGGVAADKIDVEATAHAVLERLKAEPEQTPWWRRFRVLQGAAAAMVILAAGLFVFTRGQDELALGDGFDVPVVLESLSAEELEEVADSLLFEAPVYEQVAVGLHDLNEAQLEELLGLMEG